MKEIKLEKKGSGWKRILLKYFKMMREGGLTFYLSEEQGGAGFCLNTDGTFSCTKFGVDDCGAQACIFFPLTPQIVRNHNSGFGTGFQDQAFRPKQKYQ
jgi:hypothetical protein